MTDPDPYISLSLSDRLHLLAFEAELANLPRYPLKAAGSQARLGELEVAR